MKIAIICSSGLPVPAVKGGAIETLVEIICKENEVYKKIDIDVYSIYDEEAIIESKKYEKSNFIYLCKNKNYIKIRNKLVSFNRKILKLDSTYTYSKEIAKRINNSYDKVIIEGDSSIIIPIAKKVDKEKIYFHIHHNPLSTNHNQFKKEISSINSVITVSEFISEAMKECMIPKSVQTVILKNCTDIQRFNKSRYINERIKLRKQYEVNDEDIVIMFSGRPVPQKGIKELLLAFKSLCSKYNNIKLLIVGNSGFGKEVTTEFDKTLKDIAETIKEKVIFTGFIHNSKMPQIHAMGDIAVIPSIYDDPAPLVVMECMASGLPIITTDSGGIPEYIGNDNCICVKRDNSIVDNLGIALEELIINKEYRNTLGEKAHNYAQQFNRKKFYEDFINIIE